MEVRRTHAWLVLAGYLCLALAIPALTPVPPRDTMAPISPLVFAGNAEDDAMMQSLRLQASAALYDLQAHTAQQTAKAF
jgi:hypothetical protein